MELIVKQNDKNTLFPFTGEKFYISYKTSHKGSLWQEIG